MGNPLRYKLEIAGMFLAGTIYPDQKLLHLESFFGVVKVADITSLEGMRFRASFHGTTVHGHVSLESKDGDGRHEPSAYYHKTSPDLIMLPNKPGDEFCSWESTESSRHTDCLRGVAVW